MGKWKPGGLQTHTDVPSYLYRTTASPITPFTAVLYIIGLPHTALPFHLHRGPAKGGRGGTSRTSMSTCIFAGRAKRITSRCFILNSRQGGTCDVCQSEPPYEKRCPVSAGAKLYSLSNVSMKLRIRRTECRLNTSSQHHAGVGSCCLGAPP